MKRVNQLLDIVWEGLTKKDYDCVFGVFGDEGTGKSTFLLHVLEYWLIKKYGSVKSEDIKFIDLSIEKWGEQFSQCSKYDMSILDEGGKLSNKRSMSNLNVAINQAYQIIRGDNLCSILALPSMFDLDGFFTKRRMRGCFVVYKRGRLAYWSRERMRKIVALNQYNLIKNMWVVKPTFYDTFPKYEGILKSQYLEKKKDFMKDTRINLAKAIKMFTDKSSVVGELSEQDIKIKELKDQGKSFKKIADELGISPATAHKKFKNFENIHSLSNV